MLSATAYGLFFTISIVAIVVCILTIEKLWSKKRTVVVNSIPHDVQGP